MERGTSEMIGVVDVSQGSGEWWRHSKFIRGAGL